MIVAMRRAMLIVVTTSMLFVPALRGQAPGTGAIDGRVSDSAGLRIARARVDLVSESTSAARNIETTAEGFFAATLLTPGAYSVTVAHPGFETKVAERIIVRVGETTSLTLTLSVARLHETVGVHASTEVVQGQSATLGRTVDDRAIQGLPLANRNFTQILSLSPGVVVALPDATALGRGTQNVTADGNKTTANNIQFNGIDANNLAQNSARNDGEEVGVAVPAPDTIQEFKVQTANYDATYGRGTGANVDLISKSGSDGFHGTAWEFVRNDVFNANTFFLKRAGQPRPVLKQNQFGGSLGGPILKEKMFFFGAYQGLRSSNGLGNTSTVFLPALTSDRSATALGAQFCGAGPTNAGGLLACDGSNINPVALKLLNFKFANGQFAVPGPQILLPPVTGQTPIGQSTFSIPSTYQEDQFTLNLDETLTARNQVTARFLYSQAPTITAFSANAATVPGWGTNESDQNAMLVLGDSHVFNSNLVNLARFGFMRFAGNASVAHPISTTDLGTQSPQGTSGADVPTPSIGIDGLFSVGDGGTPFQKQTTNSFIYQDILSMTHGRYSLRAGVEGKHHQVMLNPPFVTSGFMEMRTFNDFLVGQSASQNGSPDGFSNLELTAAASGIFRKDERYNDLAAFVQDDIRLSSRASVFVGARYEIFGAPTEIHGRLATFDPSIATLAVPTDGSFSGFVVPRNFPGDVPEGVVHSNRDGFWANRYLDLSPRIGFAVQLSDRPTVLIRGGYGIYFDRLSAGLVENLVNQSPFAQTQVLFNAQNGGASEEQPFAPLLPLNTSYPIFVPRVPGGAQTLYAVDPNVTNPYTQEYNLNLQASFAHDYLFEAGYVGTRSLHLPGGVEFNQALLATPQQPINGETTNTASNIANRLPYAGVSTGSIVYQTRFPSNYNSLQTSLTKLLSHGLQFLGSYTWSKSMDETSGTNGSDVFEEWLLSNNQNNPQQAYGPTDFDRTHRAVISLVYQTPNLSLASRMLSEALTHWQASAIGVAQSGSPLTILDNNAGLVYGNFENRAARPTSNPHTSGSMFDRVLGHYLDAGAFPSAAIAPGGLTTSDTDFGNSSTGFLRGPVQRNLDFAVERTFAIRESLSFHFRTEFFNITNTTNFSNPNTSLSSGQAFGTITATANNPRIIQFAGRFSF